MSIDKGLEMVIERLTTFIEKHKQISLVRSDAELFALMGYNIVPYKFINANESKHYVASGLCHLVFNTTSFELRAIHGVTGKDMLDVNAFLANTKFEFFQSWDYFCGDKIYPVGFEEEFAKIKNIADNPLRLDLAKHLLEGFKNVQAERKA